MFIGDGCSAVLVERDIMDPSPLSVQYDRTAVHHGQRCCYDIDDHYGSAWCRGPPVKPVSFSGECGIVDSRTRGLSADYGHIIDGIL